MNANKTRTRAQRGVTLVESLTVLSVASVAMGSMAPGWQRALERRHLEGASAQLETDIQLARSESVARNRTLRMSFAVSSSGSCYVVHTGRLGECACKPTGSPVCSGTAKPLRNVSFAASDAVRLQSNVASIVFDPTKGTSTPAGTVRVTGQSGLEVRLVVNIMGRVRSCTSSAGLQGYARC